MRGEKASERGGCGRGKHHLKYFSNTLNVGL
jgi:hypothetical protein